MLAVQRDARVGTKKRLAEQGGIIIRNFSSLFFKLNCRFCLNKINPAGFLQVMEVDINGDGTIDFQEFLGMMKSKANEADQESDLREAFKIFDRDKDGYIDMKELKKVIILTYVEKDEKIVKVVILMIIERSLIDSWIYLE